MPSRSSRLRGSIPDELQELHELLEPHSGGPMGIDVRGPRTEHAAELAESNARGAAEELPAP